MCTTHQSAYKLRHPISIQQTEWNTGPLSKYLQFCQNSNKKGLGKTSQSAFNSSSWECLKWPMMFLPAAIISVMPRCFPCYGIIPYKTAILTWIKYVEDQLTPITYYLLKNCFHRLYLCSPSVLSCFLSLSLSLLDTYSTPACSASPRSFSASLSLSALSPFWPILIYGWSIRALLH